MEAYRALLNAQSYLDYSAIMDEAVAVLFSDEDLRKRLAERVRHVIVDEYQDVNPVQESVVQALRDLGADLCVVGDDDQVLYQWRGSDVQNILTFEDRYAPVKQVRLEDNFRSSEGIIETARAFIEQNAERLVKEMKPAGAQVYEPGDLVALSFDNPDDEAHYIVETCRALQGVAIKEPDKEERGIAWSDMAILLRSVAKNAAPITRALDPLLTGAQEHFDAGKESDSGYLKPLKKLLIDLVVSKETVTRALNAASALFLLLEDRGHQVGLAPRDQPLSRHSFDEREHGGPQRHYSNLWGPVRPTVLFIGTVAIGLTIFEMSEEVEVMIGDKPPKPEMVRKMVFERMQSMNQKLNLNFRRLSQKTLPTLANITNAGLVKAGI